MSEDTRPDLTPEEIEAAEEFARDAALASLRDHDASMEREEALSLAREYLQRAGPDGGPPFTREMVDALRWAAVIVELNILGPSYAENERYLRAIHDTAARLTSLLPPRKET